MSLDEFLNPTGENNVAQPGLSDIIADFSNDGHGDGAQDDEYILARSRQAKRFLGNIEDF